MSKDVNKHSSRISVMRELGCSESKWSDKEIEELNTETYLLLYNHYYRKGSIPRKRRSANKVARGNGMKSTGRPRGSKDSRKRKRRSFFSI